jgi:arylsulfatase A-like enzyme
VSDTPGGLDVERAGIRLLLALVPVFAIGLALKIARIVIHPAELTFGEGWLLLLPDLLFQSGLLLLGGGLLALTARHWALASLLTLQLAALVYFFAAVVAHGYFVATRASLDFGQVAFAFGRPVDMLPMLASQVAGPTLGLAAVAVVLLLSAPWIAPRWIRPTPVERSLGARGSRRPAVGAWRYCSVALALACLSFVPRVERLELAFARDPLANLALGSFEDEYASIGGDTQVAGRPSGPGEIARRSTGRPPNIAIIMLESTRATATGIYEPKLATTPFLDELASRSLVAERAYVVIPHTSKAVVSTVCGIEPSPSLSVVESHTSGIPGRCLAHLLGDHGYHSAFIMAAFKKFERFDVLARNMGFREFQSGDDMDQSGLEMSNYFGFEDAILLDANREWLASRGDEPFFVTYLTNAPHHDYRPLKRFGSVQFVEDEHENRYLNNVRYLDFIVKDLIQQYRDAGLYENTVFVIVGDHGEAFGEHGLYTHDDVLYEEGLRVPLLIHAPGLPERVGRVAAAVSQLDLAPTLLDLLGFDFAAADYAGHSITAVPNTRPLFAACYRSGQCLAGIRGDEKFIYFHGSRPAQLFDLADDPGERIDLAPERPEAVARWTTEVLDWRRSVHAKYRDWNGELLARTVKNWSPVPQRPLAVRYGDLVELLGYQPPGGELVRKRAFRFTYFFRALDRVPPGYRLVLRARSDNHERLFEHVPGRGLHPLESWRAGEHVWDVHHFAIPDSWHDPWVDLCIELRRSESGTVPAHGEGVDSGDCAHIGRYPLEQV